MLNIYICVSAKYINKLTSTLNKIIFICNMDIKVTYTTSNSNEFIYQVKNIKSKSNIYFIEEENMYFLVCKAIKEIDRTAIIILLLGENNLYEYLIESIENRIQLFGVVNFKRKNTFENEIYNCLSDIEKVFRNYKNNDLEIFVAKTREQIVLENYENILYFTTNKLMKNRIQLITTNGIYDFKGTIKELEKKLTKNFIKVSSGTIVNLNYIQEINWIKKVIVLKDGGEIYFTIRKNTMLKKLEYYLKGKEN